MNDREKAEKCTYFEPAGTFRDDNGEPTCCAHLAEGRVFSCGVWLGSQHLNRENPVNLCVDGLMGIPKALQTGGK